MFSSSSPSYILMSAIDLAVRYMDEEAGDSLVNLFKLQNNFRKKAKKLKYIEIWEPAKVYQYDFTKFIIGIKDKSLADKLGMSGNEIKRYLKQFKIELEMSGSSYALALMGIGDTKEGFNKLFVALKKLDKIIDGLVVCFFFRIFGFFRQYGWPGMPKQRVGFVGRRSLTAVFTKKQQYH